MMRSLHHRCYQLRLDPKRASYESLRCCKEVCKAKTIVQQYNIYSICSIQCPLLLTLTVTHAATNKGIEFLSVQHYIALL